MLIRQQRCAAPEHIFEPLELAGEWDLALRHDLILLFYRGNYACHDGFRSRYQKTCHCVGVTMALLVTAAWGCIALAADKIVKRESGVTPAVR